MTKILKYTGVFFIIFIPNQYHCCMLRTDWLVYCVARFAATVGNGFSNGNVGFGEARMSSLSFHATLANPLCFFPLPTPDL